MSSDSKTHVLKKLKRLAILLKKIHKLGDTTSRKLRQIIQMFEEASQSPVGYILEVSKPNNRSRFTEWKYDCPVAPDVF